MRRFSSSKANCCSLSQWNTVSFLVNSWTGIAFAVTSGINFSEYWTRPINDRTSLAALGGLASQIYIAAIFSSYGFRPLLVSSWPKKVNFDILNSHLSPSIVNLTSLHLSNTAKRNFFVFLHDTPINNYVIGNVYNPSIAPWHISVSNILLQWPRSPKRLFHSAAELRIAELSGLWFDLWWELIIFYLSRARDE